MILLGSFLITLISGGCLYQLLKSFFRTYKHKREKIRGPPEKFLLRESIEFALSSKESVHNCMVQGFERVRGLKVYKIFMWNMVVFNHYDPIKWVSTHEDWLSRPMVSEVFDRSFGKPLGILQNSGTDWKNSRSFTQKTLKLFGLGKQSIMQVRIEDELVSLLNSIKTKMEKDNGVWRKFCVKNMFNLSVVKVLWNIAAGSKPVEDCGEFDEILQLSDDINKSYQQLHVKRKLFPFLMYIAPRFSGYDAFKKNTGRMREYCMNLIKERRREGRYLSAQDDFIESYLYEIDQEKKSNEKNVKFSDESLAMVLFDLFEVGSTTTGGTLEYTIQHMIRNPHVQSKVQEEIFRILGHERYPTSEDRLKMPYTQATILECGRVSPTVLLNVRSAIRDTFVEGYFIKKDTIGLLNYYELNMDKDFWGDPHVFRPERFLDDNNNLINTDRVFTFGGGKRYCVGDAMAKSMVFTFLVGILQNYTVSQVPGENDVFKDPYIGLTTQPQHFNAIFTKNNGIS